MKDKKAAKKLIKRAKHHLDWYPPEDVKYAKMMRKQLEYECKINPDDPRCREINGVHSESKQSKKSGKSRSRWIAKILHKARSLVGL